jgi:hypothetical protein
MLFDYINHLKMRNFFSDVNLHRPFRLDELQTLKKVIFVVSYRSRCAYGVNCCKMCVPENNL